MTRDELLNAFFAELDAEGGFPLPPPLVTGQPTAPDGKTRVVETFQSQDGTRVGERHIVYWWDADMLAKANREFYVIDPNTAQETASWFKGNDPRPPAPGPTFQDELTAWLDAKVGDGTIDYYTVVSTIPHLERARVDVNLHEAGKLKQYNVGVWKNTSGDLVYEIVQA